MIYAYLASEFHASRFRPAATQGCGLRIRRSRSGIISLGYMNKSVCLPLALAAGLCPGALFGSTVYNGHEYELLPSSTWAVAESAAVAWGGHLVTINDAAEESWLRGQFGSGNLWIGFTDQAVEGTWAWISGEPVTYVHWNAGEPNQAGDEDYGVLNWNGGNGAWNDWSGGNSIPAIAERSVPDAGSTWALSGAIVCALALLRHRRVN